MIFCLGTNIICALPFLSTANRTNAVFDRPKYDSVR